MNNILILSENYPSSKNLYAMAFVHSRNIEYLKQGMRVTVLNFSTHEAYEFEGITVVPAQSIKNLSEFDSVVSHAPNIRNHLRYLKRHIKDIKKLTFIFHGHEILILSKYYPTPYAWEQQTSLFKNLFQNLYDHIKLKLMKFFINKYHQKLSLIFVSDWMKKHGLTCLGDIKTKNIYVINNPVHNSFLNSTYDPKYPKLGDCVTIRPLNGSKYGIDLVVSLAINNPSLSFTVYGKGDFFKFNPKPDNIIHINKFINQKDLPDLLNQYRAAVMPTRLDAQGVMMCEMATYGIPIITSSIPICHEMLRNFNNISFIDNNDFNKSDVNLNAFNYDKILKVNSFLPQALAQKEILVFQGDHDK